MRKALIVAAVLAVPVLGGCAAATSLSSEAPPSSPLARYALRVEPGMDRIALAVHETGVSANQQIAIQDLIRRYAASGAASLTIQAPSGDDPASASHAYAVADTVRAMGVPADQVRVIGYAAPDPRAPVLAGFEVLQAVIPNCAAIPRALGSRFSNQPTANFGCAVNANLAAQIADPRDILRPRDISPADSGRAAVVFDRYRRGETTSAAQEPLIEGAIANAVE